MTQMTPIAAQAPARPKVQGAPARPQKPPARAARAKARHRLLGLSFLAFVLVPACLAGYYMFARAADQYTSTVGFSVRSEEFSSPLDVLGGLGKLSSGSSTDTDILHRYLHSQEIVETVDRKLDLRAIFSNAPDDPVFRLTNEASIEDLVTMWKRMVLLTYDPGTGLIEVEVRAFDPDHAHSLAQEILAVCSELINDISQVARVDATAYARDDLMRTEENLKAARLAVGQFRDDQQIVDPTMKLQARSGILSALESQLAAALIEGDLLSGVTRTADPRLEQNRRRVAAIEARIAAEQQKIGSGGITTSEEQLTRLVGTYETLVVEREFAEQSYLAARAAYDQAVAEARRQSRYLAAHIPPTHAQTSTHPQRVLLTLGCFALLSLGWALFWLMAYAVMDRK